MKIPSLLNSEDVDPKYEKIEYEEKKKEFVQELAKYLENIGKPITKFPVVGYKQLDLYQFYNLVQENGGYASVTNTTGTWVKIWKTLDYQLRTDASSRLKRIYERYLLDFEYYKFPHRKTQNSKKMSNDAIDGNDSNSLSSKRSNLQKRPPPKSQDVDRDDDGKPILPLSLSGGLTLHNLGRVQEVEGEKWPIGFKSSRIFSSYLQPNRNVQYTSEIQFDGELKFVVTAMDDTEHPVSALSPSDAWKIVVSRISEKESDGPTRNVPVSGPLRFGLLHPMVRKLLEELGDQVENYTHKCNEWAKKKKKLDSRSYPSFHFGKQNEISVRSSDISYVVG